MGWLSSLFGGGKKDSGGGDSQLVWPEWTVAPQYSFTEPRLQLTSDFISDQIKRLNEGKYPSYYENALPTLREGMHRPLYETYYGRAGEPGVLRGQMDVGSITGLGPRSTQAAVERSLYDYATSEKQIDEYLTKMGVDIMREEAYRFPALSISMPKGPDAQLAYPQVVGSQQPDVGGAAQSLGSMFNAGSILDTVTGWLGGGTTTAQQPEIDVNYPNYSAPWSASDFSLRQPSNPYQKYYDSVPYASQPGSTTYTSADFGLYK